jgi:hypothetical protein
VSNIDSKTESDTHDRSKTRRVRIRLLLTHIQILRFSAARYPEVRGKVIDEDQLVAAGLPPLRPDPVDYI